VRFGAAGGGRGGGLGGPPGAGGGAAEDEMLHLMMGMPGAGPGGAGPLPPGAHYPPGPPGGVAGGASALSAALQGLGTADRAAYAAGHGGLAMPQPGGFPGGLEGGEDGWLRYDGGAGAGMPGGIPPAHAQAGMAAPAQAGQMYAAGNRYAGHPSPSDAGGYLGMSGGEAPGYPGAAFGAAGVPQAIPPMRRMPGVWDPHTPSPMAGGMLMTDDDLATSAPGRLDRAGMRRVGSMGPNMFAMLGTSGGASVPRSGSQQSLATVDEMDPVERVRKRRRVSAQRSRVRKAMYILSLENENKLLRAELQRLHAATQAGAPQVLQAMDPPVTFPNKSDALKPEATVSQTIESLNPTRSEGLPDHGEVNS